MILCPRFGPHFEWKIPFFLPNALALFPPPKQAVFVALVPPVVGTKYHSHGALMVFEHSLLPPEKTSAFPNSSEKGSVLQQIPSPSHFPFLSFCSLNQLPLKVVRFLHLLSRLFVFQKYLDLWYSFSRATLCPIW